ncbi:MAG TPA: hypothetical protein PLU50_11365, partial [Pseudobdellovibrionaceae bacterium]|nr:hypothetical protein [Pseudobdellovibrionaceae bacterium]
YDGAMDPFNAKDSYFCTTVSFDIYRRSGLTMKVNPYNPDYWSRISGARYELFQFLGISSQRVPAPGDVEQSVFFDLVGMEIDVELLHRERIVSAAIDLLLKYLDQEPEILVNIHKSLGQFGTGPVNKEFLKSLEAKHLIPSDFVKKFSAKIPDGLNLRQIVFFGLLDQVYTPRLTQIAELQLGKGPYGQNTLRKALSEVIKNEVDIFLKLLQKK